MNDEEKNRELVNERIELYSLQQKTIIGKWLEEELVEVAKSLRKEFDELGEVTDATKKRLKEILEDKNKREKFAEVLTKEEEVTELGRIDELGNITDVPKEEQMQDLLTYFLTKKEKFTEVLSKEEERMRLIYDILSTLTHREEDMLIMYFGIDRERLTITEIGLNYDITKNTVKRIKNRGIRKVIHRVTKNESLTKLASHIDKGLIERCVKERGKLLDEFMMNILYPPKKVIEMWEGGNLY